MGFFGGVRNFGQPDSTTVHGQSHQSREQARPPSGSSKYIKFLHEARLGQLTSASEAASLRQVFVCGLIPCDAGAGAPAGTAALSPKESFLSSFSGPKPSWSLYTRATTQMQAVVVCRGAADGCQHAGRARKGGRTLPKVAGWLLRARQHSLHPPAHVGQHIGRMGTASPWQLQCIQASCLHRILL